VPYRHGFECIYSVEKVMSDIAVIHVHGYNVGDYRNTVGRFDDVCDEAGLLSLPLVYHADNVREARRMNPDTAHRLADLIRHLKATGNTVIVAAHSNGNTVLRMAYDLCGVSPDVALCVQPALPSNMHPSPGAKHVAVYWNPSDSVVKLGKFLTWLTKFISPEWAARRNWGQMGATGYTGKAENVLSLNTTDDCHPIKAAGHSAIYSEGCAGYWMHFMFTTAVARAQALC
jgi:hypothetical protein